MRLQSFSTTAATLSCTSNREAPGAADVTLVEEDAVDDALDRLVQRRVLEDDVGGLAAELQRERQAPIGELGLDLPADGGRPREGDLVDVGVADEGPAPSPGGRRRPRAGSSASWQISASSSAVRGVGRTGLRTATLPHASAGASFHAAISSGKFHGTICAATPRGRVDAAGNA